MLERLIDGYGLRQLASIEQTNDREVTAAGLSKILSLTKIDQGEWPVGFDLRLVNNAGNFTTRLKAYHKDWYGEALSPEILAKIGLLAESHSTPADTILFDITDEIMTWPPGSFHFGTNLEAASCLRRLSEYAPAVNNYIDFKAVTMRMFRPGGNPKGFNFYGKYMGAGRVFLLPYEGQIAMINQYGFGGNATKHATILVQALQNIGIDAEYYFARVGDHNDLYFNNNSRGSDIFVVKDSKEGSYSEVSFSIKQTWKAKKCDCCKTMIRYKPRSPKRFCDECGHTCAHCGKETVNAFLAWASDTEKWYCTGCAGRLNKNVCGLLTEGICSCEECSHG